MKCKNKADNINDKLVLSVFILFNIKLIYIRNLYLKAKRKAIFLGKIALMNIIGVI